MQKEEHVSQCVAGAFVELLATSGRRLDHPRAARFGDGGGGIGTAPVGDDDLVGCLLAGQNIEQRWQMLRFVEGGNDHGDHSPSSAHRASSALTSPTPIKARR